MESQGTESSFPYSSLMKTGNEAALLDLAQRRRVDELLRLGPFDPRVGLGHPAEKHLHRLGGEHLAEDC